MEDLLSNQETLIAAIEQLISTFKKTGKERKTPEYAKRKLDQLDLYWKEFESNHQQLSKYRDVKVSYFQDNHYQQALEFYDNTRAHILQFIPKPSTPSTSEIGERALLAPGPSMSSTLPEPKYIHQGNPSKLEEMLRKQKTNFKAFSRSLAAIDLDQVSETWEFEDILKTVETRWTNIDKLHWDIDCNILEENEEYDDTFNEYEQKYLSIKKTINSRMRDVSYKEKSTPKMDIPIFNGNYHQWLSFKDLFSETIHTNKSLSPAQKMQFLKSKIRGEAEKLIQHLRISTDNYPVCWDILNQRYNNTKLIFNSHINILLSLPTIQNQTAAQIKRLHDTTNESLNAIKSLGVDISNWDPLIVHILSQKLDVETHNDYVESLQKPRDLPTLHDFLRFLEGKFTSLELSRRKPETAKSTQQQQEYNYKKLPGRFLDSNPTKNIHFKSFVNHSKSNFMSQRKCPLCNNNHNLYHCKTFLEAKPDSKLNTVNKLHLCSNCLYKHNDKECQSSKTCRHCAESHNTLLHDAYVSSTSSNDPANSSPNNQLKFNACVSQPLADQDEATESVLATAKIYIQAADGSRQTMRALIDPCAQSSLITEHAAKRLGLPRKPCKWIVYGVGSKANHSKGVVEVTITSTQNDYTFVTEAFVMKNMIQSENLPHQTLDKPVLPYPKEINLADSDFYISQKIDLILGVDVYTNIILPGIIRDKTYIAQQTQLGWIISGQFAQLKPYHYKVLMMTKQDIQKFWDIEDLADSSSDNISKEDNQCILQYQSETRRLPNGRYVVRLPLKPEVNEKLGATKSKAVAQFLQQERKFTKNQVIAKRYKEVIDEYLDLGHMHECNGKQTPTESYLPHHYVLRDDSTTTSIRIVFNASAVSSSGNSLNDLMYRGPNLQQDLLSLIIKWRQYKVAFTADIEKMFRQILVHENDQAHQKLIWRESPDQPLREYQISTVVFGFKAAPFLAMMTLKQLAKDERHRFPEAAKIVEDSFYMDDLLHGHHDVESAKRLKTDLITMMKSGGFNLRKWTSNVPELLDEVPNCDNQAFDFRHQETTKTLGLRWNPHDDQFSFQLNVPKDLNIKPTKRSLLSDASKIFDPLGWLSPITVSLKLLFQESWQLDLQWDDTLPENISSKWQKTREDLEHIKKIRIHRWLSSHKDDDIELHGFCDASTKAYAGVVYCKSKTKDQSRPNDSTVVIIAAKSRLVPTKKTISLPRLELCAALLLSKLMKTIQYCLSDHKIKTFGWSDSTAVLGWLNGNPDRWKTFVANRVIQITNIIPPECWNYVKSSDNPADCASRGITAEELTNHATWWKGPEWLSSFDYQKTKETSRSNYDTKIDEEIRKPQSIRVGVVTKCENDTVLTIINNHSNFERASRVLAWMFRMTSHQNRPAFLTIPELRKAKHILIKYVQHSEFAEDIEAIKKQNQVNPKSKLLTFRPFIDKEGLLRVGGRLKNANIAERMKHPLILPYNHHLTNMLIDEGHKMTFHGGARLTLAWLRQQFWILGGTNAVKKRLRNCVTCRRHDPVHQDQLMGDLPAPRTNISRPFHYTGVDLTGFVDLKCSKGRGIKTSKGYVVVFVCMVTKAVFLDLVSDLSASGFLAALRRLSARRGKPGHIFSDNGTNFCKANRRLQEEMLDLKSTLNHEFYAELTKMDIEWHFNAPSWPSAGGLWEAAVKSLKHHLKRVIGEQKLTYEEFSTLLAQIEACLNSRPLCALTEDPDDLDYLTPSHFLSSGPVLTIVETEKDERTRWQLTQKIYEDIWKRWRSEYLAQITTRSKWQKPKKNIAIDDVVLIHDANLPAGKWALGRVIELHPGKDGYVRVVTLKTKTGTIKRPVVKISILPTGKPLTTTV